MFAKNSDAVLGLLVDLLLWVVGSQVALAAGVGVRAWAAEKVCRVWQAEHEPSEPSGIDADRCPVLGQVAGSSLPFPGSTLTLRAVALPAAVDGRGRVAHEGSPSVFSPLVAFDDFGEHVV